MANTILYSFIDTSYFVTILNDQATIYTDMRLHSKYVITINNFDRNDKVSLSAKHGYLVIAVFRTDRTVSIWDIFTGTLVKKLVDYLFKRGIVNICCSPDAKDLCIIAVDGTFAIYDSETLMLKYYIILDVQNNIESFCYLNNNQFVTKSNSGYIQTWTQTTQQQHIWVITNSIPLNVTIRKIVYNTQLNHIACVCNADYSRIYIIDLRINIMIYAITRPGCTDTDAMTNSVFYTNDGRHLIVLDNSQKLTTYDARTGHMISTLSSAQIRNANSTIHAVYALKNDTFALINNICWPKIIEKYID